MVGEHKPKPNNHPRMHEVTWMPSQEETLANLISSGYLKSKSVAAAMRKIKREDFIPPDMAQHAWEDHPLPIGFGQTISAPHMYAFMLEAAQVKESDKILEIGTGSGYGAALLSALVGKKGKVYSVESILQLVEFARSNLKKAGCIAEVIEGDGYFGYPLSAPYDKILVTAACGAVPQQLINQLKVGGKMLIPIGSFFQDLLLVEKTKSGIRSRPILPVIFVPLIRKNI